MLKKNVLSTENRMNVLIEKDKNNLMHNNTIQLIYV